MSILLYKWTIELIDISYLFVKFCAKVLTCQVNK